MHLPLAVSQAFAYCIKVYVYMYRYEAGFPWKLSERERKGWGSEGVTRFFLSLYVCVCVCVWEMTVKWFKHIWQTFLFSYTHIWNDPSWHKQRCFLSFSLSLKQTNWSCRGDTTQTHTHSLSFSLSQILKERATESSDKQLSGVHLFFLTICCGHITTLVILCFLFSSARGAQWCVHVTTNTRIFLVINLICNVYSITEVACRNRKKYI